MFPAYKAFQLISIKLFTLLSIVSLCLLYEYLHENFSNISHEVMKEPSVEGRKSRLVAIDMLLQFLDCCIHAFLYTQRVYEVSMFDVHKRFGVCVRLCAVKEIREYTKEFCLSIRDAILFDRIAVVFLQYGDARVGIEIPADFGRSVFYSIPTVDSRSDLEIASLCANLLSDAYLAVERKLGLIKNTSIGNGDWSLYVETKPNLSTGSEVLELPTGFAVLKHNEDLIDSANCVRYSLKSVSIDDTVVVSVYGDKLCGQSVSTSTPNENMVDIDSTIR